MIKVNILQRKLEDVHSIVLNIFLIGLILNKNRRWKKLNKFGGGKQTVKENGRKQLKRIWGIQNGWEWLERTAERKGRLNSKGEW